MMTAGETAHVLVQALPYVYRFAGKVVVVKLGAGGVVDLYNSSGTVHLLADIAGYYTAGAISGSRVTWSGTGAASPGSARPRCW